MRSLALKELPPLPPHKNGWPWTEISPQLLDSMSGSEIWPRISIVTPSFNQSQYLEETIRSVLLQGYPNLEYLIIDGGSTDGSVEIIRQYKPWLAYWVSEPDAGQSAAINKGFQKVTGDIVAWLNSDDTYSPGALQKVAAWFQREPETGFFYGDMNVVDEQNHLIEARQLPPFDLSRLIEHNLPIPQPATFINRKFVGSENLVREDLHYAMDFDLWLRLAWRAPVGHIPTPLANFRFWENSKSGSQMDKWGVELFKVLDDFLATPGLPPEISSLRRRAYSGVYSFGGAGYYHAGEVGTALKWLLRAVWFYPPALWQTRLGAQVLRAVVRDHLFFAIRRLTLPVRSKLFPR